MRRNDRDLIELFSGMTQLWRGRWWILLTTVVVTSLFAALAFWMTPVYRASHHGASGAGTRRPRGNTVVRARDAGRWAGITGGDCGRNGSTQGTDEAVAVLKSRQFTEQFITDRNLLPALYPDPWDPKAAKWRVPADDQPTMATAVKRFQKDVLTITQDKKTGLLTLQIESPDRIAAADWANDLVRRINAWMRARSIASTEAFCVPAKGDGGDAGRRKPESRSAGCWKRRSTSG
ncbi:MAG: Wzz/FepE/Etk N-terminal domain-containing protein [Steroidobacteraceae bacterium]